MTIRFAYTREEAAAACGVSVDTIKRAIRTGALRAKRSGRNDKGEPAGKYLIPSQALQDWLDSLDAA